MISAKTNYIFLSYLLSLILFFNFNSGFTFWICMEVNLLIFILLLSSIFQEKSNEFYSSMLYYFMIQSLGSLMFLISIIFSDFYMATEDMSLMIILSLFFKTSLIPFHFWIFKLVKTFNEFCISIVLTFQKIPLFFLLFNFDSSFFFLFLILNLLGVFVMVYSSNAIDMFVGSSIYLTFWLYLIFMNSSLIFFSFFMIYFFFLFKVLSNLSRTSEFLTLFSCYLFFLGLPPLSWFFFKFYVLDFIVSVGGGVDIFIIWILLFVSLFSYVKFFYYIFSGSNFLYLMNKFSFFFTSFICFTFSSFLFMIC